MNPPIEVASARYTIFCPETKEGESVVFPAQPSLKAKSFWKPSRHRHAGQRGMKFPRTIPENVLPKNPCCATEPLIGSNVLLPWHPRCVPDGGSLHRRSWHGS